MKPLLLIRYLFKECIVYNVLFTVIAIPLLISYGQGSYPYIFWLKVVGYIGTALAYYWSRKKHLYFFYNLRLNVKQLVLIALSVDMMILLFAALLIFMIGTL